MANKISNQEIKQNYDQMNAEAQNEYYNSFLQAARQNFKKYTKLILWAVFLIVTALICFIPVGFDPFINISPFESAPHHLRKYSSLAGIVCLILTAVCIFAVFSFKLKNKVMIVVFFALNIVGLYIVALMSRGGMGDTGRVYVTREAAWAILLIVNIIAVILTLKKCQRNANSEKEMWFIQGIAAVFVLNSALTFQYIRYTLAASFDTKGDWMNTVSLMTVFLAVIGVILFVRATLPYGLNAFKAANTCKALKGKRLDGTKKIFWCTLYPVINAYSTLIMFTFTVAFISLIMSGVVSANKSGRTASVRITYFDGRQSYYVENEKMYDEQNRQIGRVINDRVYDNEMNQTGYISGDKIIPL